MLSNAKHPFDESSTIYAQGIPHFVRNDIFPGKTERTEVNNYEEYDTSAR